MKFLAKQLKPHGFEWVRLFGHDLREVFETGITIPVESMGTFVNFKQGQGGVMNSVGTYTLEAYLFRRSKDAKPFDPSVIGALVRNFAEKKRLFFNRFLPTRV